MFHRSLHILQASFACLCLSSFAHAQGPPVLGQIIRSSAASVSGVSVPSGGTLLAGDVVTTSAGGGALIKFSTNRQMELSENTAVSFSGIPDQVVARVSQGTVVAEQADPDSLVIETSACRLQPARRESVAYSVTVSPGASANISARQGTLLAAETVSGRAYILGQGETSSCPRLAAAPVPERPEAITPEPPVRAGQAPPSTVAAAGSHTGLLLVILGLGGAAGAGLALAGGHGGGGGTPASPSAP